MTAASRHLAQCPHGLEGALEGELLGLGFAGVQPVFGGVLFEADRRQAARALLWLRSAVRVLEPLRSGTVGSFDDLYDLVASIAWEELIGTRHTFAVHASVSHAAFNDHQFAALKVKDAVADRVRSRRGERPNVDRKSPDVPLRAIVRGDRARIFRDLAGSSLHRRGNRPIQVRSPLSEAVAAGLLLLSGWTGESSLIDPMCGSGTFLFEAISMALGRAPGRNRSFAAERFPDADAECWSELRSEARDLERHELEVPILGSDHHEGAIGIARKVARDAGLEQFVTLQVADAATAEPPFTPDVVVCNPPWGGRMEQGQELQLAWRALGTFLRRCPGTTAFVLSGERSLTRHLGLRAEGRWPVRIGQFDARWIRYTLREKRQPS